MPDCLSGDRGSIPRGVATLFLPTANYKLPTAVRAYRLTARTSGSHPDGRGSNPRTLTIRLACRLAHGRPKFTRCGPVDGRLPREQENSGSIPDIATIRLACRLAHGRPSLTGRHMGQPLRPRFVQWKDASPTKKRRVFDSLTWDQPCRCRPTPGCALRNGVMPVEFRPAAPIAGAARCAPTRL